jgi:hypothetical protein
VLHTPKASLFAPARAQSVAAVHHDCFERESKAPELVLGLKAASRSNRYVGATLADEQHGGTASYQGNGVTAADRFSTIAAEHDILLLPCCNADVGILRHSWTRGHRP